ncbi:hypothetical protein B5F86_01470 [Lachnoclostridium sp. An298]|nr:hypothetical protein B5F86_01470 [Lachnoclostridium sp. An298]
MDKTHSRYGDLLNKAMKKKEDRMLASAMRIRDNINAENKRKEQEKLRRELKKESDQIEEQNRQQETLDFANAMLDRYKQRREAERKKKEAEEEERKRRESSRRFVEHMNWMDAAISHTKEMLSK